MIITTRFILTIGVAMGQIKKENEVHNFKNDTI